MPIVAADDRFGDTVRTQFGPYRRAVAITPSDTDDLVNTAYGLYIGVAGNVTLITAEGDTILLTAPLVGTVIPIVFNRVKATGTSAGGLVALR